MQLSIALLSWSPEFSVHRNCPRAADTSLWSHPYSPVPHMPHSLLEQPVPPLEYTLNPGALHQLDGTSSAQQLCGIWVSVSVLGALGAHPCPLHSRISTSRQGRASKSVKPCHPLLYSLMVYSEENWPRRIKAESSQRPVRPHLCLTQHSCSPDKDAPLRAWRVVPRRSYALALLTSSRSLITCHRLREAWTTYSIKKHTLHFSQSGCPTSFPALSSYCLSPSNTTYFFLKFPFPSPQPSTRMYDILGMRLCFVIFSTQKNPGT